MIYYCSEHFYIFYHTCLKYRLAADANAHYFYIVLFTHAITVKNRLSMEQEYWPENFPKQASISPHYREDTTSFLDIHRLQNQAHYGKIHNSSRRRTNRYTHNNIYSKNTPAVEHRARGSSDRDVEWFKDASIETTLVEFGNSQAMQVIDPTLARYISKKIEEFWSDADNKGFPGTLAKSTMRSDLCLLAENKYHVLAKSDGVRLMLSVFKNERDQGVSNVTDRSNTHRTINLTFTADVYKGIVMDGEMVKTNTDEYELQIFDCMVCRGESIVRKKYSERMQLARELVENNYKHFPRAPFRIVIKNPIPVSSVGDALGDGSGFHFPVDGCILVAEDEKYTSGKSKAVLKVKTHHTVDLLVRFEGKQIKLLTLNKGKLVVYQTLAPHATHLKNLSVSTFASLHNSIAECEFDQQIKKWIPLKLRTDKAVPNNLETVQLTLQNIEECIQASEVVAKLEQYDSEKDSDFILSSLQCAKKPTKRKTKKDSRKSMEIKLT